MVDDDPQALHFMRHALTEAEFEPIATADPDQVPGLLKRTKPHLVLLDLMLPGSDGLELMKDYLGKSDIPVIFVSGYGGDETISQACGGGGLVHSTLSSFPSISIRVPTVGARLPLETCPAREEEGPPSPGENHLFIIKNR